MKSIGATRGAEEMQRFMSSERMPQAMGAMMAMAERMGGGMVEIPPRSQPRGEEKK